MNKIENYLNKDNGCNYNIDNDLFQEHIDNFIIEQNELDKKLENYIKNILSEHPNWIYKDGIIYDENGKEQKF